MTIEEKARRYDEALKKAKQFHDKDLFAECNGNVDGTGNNGGMTMKSKIIRLLVAIGIVCAFLLIVTGINTLVVILSDKIGFNLEYILIPVLTAWSIWLVYEIVNRNENNKEDSHE